MTHIRVLAFLYCAVLAPHTSAESLSSTKLLQICQAYHAFCEAYVLGVVEGWNLNFPEEDKQSALCVDGLDQITARNIVIEYLNNYPPEESEWAPSVIVKAIGQKFPCNP